MVNIVRSRPRCRSHDQVEITVWCQQHLVRAGGLSPAGLMYMSCSGRGQRMFVIVGLVTCGYFGGISLQSMYLPVKPLHWASDERCNMWQVERPWFPHGTPRSTH